MLAQSEKAELLIRPSRAELEELVHAATLAPSGDNTQPWRFVVDVDLGRIEIHLDETRDPSPMNSGQRMARIAIGAALENVLCLCQNRGWHAEWGIANEGSVVLIRLLTADNRTPGGNATIAARVANRRLYDGRLLENGVLERLRLATPALGGVTTHWITCKTRIARLAELIGRADALMFSEASMRRAFLSKVRFDRPVRAAVEEGLSLASLELSFADRFMLRVLPRLPNWILRVGGVKRVFAAKARKLVESASGLCLIGAPDRSKRSDLVVGRVMQRAWLGLTEEGLAVQPMMSLLVLENVGDNGGPELLSAIGWDRLTRLRQELRATLAEIGERRPAFLMRFGYAPPPTGRTGRRLGNYMPTARP